MVPVSVASVVGPAGATARRFGPAANTAQMTMALTKKRERRVMNLLTGGALQHPPILLRLTEWKRHTLRCQSVYPERSAGSRFASLSIDLPSILRPRENGIAHLH